MLWGFFQTGVPCATLLSAQINLSATGTVIAPAPGKRIYVYSIVLIVSAALSVRWRDGSSADLEGDQPLGANGGYAQALNPPNFLFGTSKGNSLDLVITGVGNVGGRVSYWLADPLPT